MTAMGLKRTLLSVALAACAWATASARAVTIEIVIDQVAFQKAEVKARVGDTVEWVNKDLFDHTATAKNGDWSVTMEPGTRGRVVLKKAGTVDYFCKLHPNMVAKLIVAK